MKRFLGLYAVAFFAFLHLPLLTLALLFACLEFGYVAGCAGRARWDAWRRRGSP